VRHLDEEQLVAFRLGYAEPSESAEIEGHLGACDTCRASLGTIEQALSAVAQLPVPERSEGYGANVWARIEPRLERPASGWRVVVAALTAPRRLAFAGGFAVVVLAAFVAGRMWLVPPASPTAPASGAKASEAAAATAAAEHAVRQDVLLVAVGDHLERSQMTLAELVNAANAPRVDISTEQARARDLVAENRLYRQTAEETGDRAVASVLDDLERVLVEVANSPSELSKSDFEQVRQRIESQGIMFKVRVLGERVRAREVRPAADGRIQG
jgi:CTP:molybdopterin cytidylyltransferase MocA